MSGLIDSLVACVGIMGSTPEGAKYLSSYIVMGSCNGTMRVLVSLDMLSHFGLDIVFGAGGSRGIMAPVVAGKLAPLVSIASPVPSMEPTTKCVEVGKEICEYVKINPRVE